MNDRSPALVEFDADLLDLLDPEVGRACPVVAEADEMFAFFRDSLSLGRYRGLALYFQSGARLWQAFRDQLETRKDGLLSCHRILDFASGWGRMTRHIVAELGAERVSVAEIQPGAVDFLRDHLGVRGWLSEHDASSFSCNEVFDAILVSSLFSHLPRERFEAWLQRLVELLSPDGWLLFSVHGQGALSGDRRIPDSGFLFEPISESECLTKDDYGSAWVSEAFVRELLERLAPDRKSTFLPRGLLSYQDLWIVAPPADEIVPASFDKLDFYLEGLRFDAVDRRLELRGWAQDRHRGEPPRLFRLELAGSRPQSRLELEPRPDVASVFPGQGHEAVGFRLSANLDAMPSFDARIRVIAVDRDGGEHFLLDRSLGSALERAVKIDAYALLEREAQRTHAELADRAQQREGALIEKIEALNLRLEVMQSSRLWRLRDWIVGS